jgi:phosphoenolpyruvate carboxykinase (ATP)
MPGFNLNVPKNIQGIDSNILLPINTWKDKQGYHDLAKKLAGQFIKNFEKYSDGTPKEVIEKGGPSTNF